MTRMKFYANCSGDCCPHGGGLVDSEGDSGNHSPAMVDTYNDPKLAFEETKKALMMISKVLAQPKNRKQKINLFNKAQEEIQREN